MDRTRSAFRPSPTKRTVRALLAAFIITTLHAPPALALSSPLLSKNQERSSDISAFSKWTSVLARYEAQHTAMAEACIGPDCRSRQWEALLKDLADKPLREQVAGINRFMNAVPYVSDRENYVVNDYWQTPYEFFEKGGDCEDYAIAKYISLRRLGVPENMVRILVVHDEDSGGIVHAVLEVQADGEALILDNQSKSVNPVASVFHYQPVFAINASTWWAYK